MPCQVPAFMTMRLVLVSLSERVFARGWFLAWVLDFVILFESINAVCGTVLFCCLAVLLLLFLSDKSFV